MGSHRCKQLPLETSAEAVRVIFERAERRNETRPGIDHNIALQLATGPLFSRGLYSNDPIETTQFCALIADLVWRAVRRDDDDAPAAVVDGDGSKPLRAGRVFAAR
jgi:tetracycline repressor-like protein